MLLLVGQLRHSTIDWHGVIEPFSHVSQSYNIGALIRVTSARDPQQLELLDDEVTSVVTGLWSYEESPVLLARCALTVYVTLC